MTGRFCVLCGCTPTRACIDIATGEPCHWVDKDLCSDCVGAACMLTHPAKDARNPFVFQPRLSIDDQETLDPDDVAAVMGGAVRRALVQA
jgi:hypothetical protein